MYASSQWAKDDFERQQAHRSLPSPDEPQAFVQSLRAKGKPGMIIRQALRNKFPQMGDDEIRHLVGEGTSFRKFMESQEVTMNAQIPLPQEVYHLSRVFRTNGNLLYVVGGAVRDFLMHHFSGGEGKYQPKDIDLATDAPPTRVAEILTSAGVRNFEKGESFGVWVAHINGHDFEIATFREDIGSSDGRHPDEVKWSTPAEDYKRRDLTMNALFYEIPDSPGKPGKIIDHGNGQGIEDIKNKKVRVVGDPYDRFKEDKLRIPRIVRFHGRYNSGDVRDVLDQRTMDAIAHFKDLRTHGVTGPRIMQEFLAGLEKTNDAASYLRNYAQLGLLPAVFPGLNVDLDVLDRLQGPVSKNPKAVLALLLRKNGTPQQVRAKLNQLNYSNEITDEVAFLLRSWQATQNPTPEAMSALAQDMAKKPDRRGDFQQFGSLVHPEVDPHHWAHLAGYQPPVFSGEEIMQQHGITAPGPEIGRIQRQKQADSYRQSFERYASSLPERR